MKKKLIVTLLICGILQVLPTQTMTIFASPIPSDTNLVIDKFANPVSPDSTSAGTSSSANLVLDTLTPDIIDEIIEVNMLTQEELQLVESLPAVNDEDAVEIDVDTSNNLDSYISLGSFKLTTYCDCRSCNGKWYGHPTKSGTDYVEGRTIAVDPKIIPLGSYVEINIPGEGWHRYRAEDTGGAIKGKRIDVFIAGHGNGYQPKYNGTCEVRLIK